MTTATGRTCCIKCGKEKATFKCGGCSQEFCYNHLTDHKQELSKQFDEIEVNRDLFRQTLTEQTSNPQKHSLIEQIDQWECDSINKIRQTADAARQLALKHTSGSITELEAKLNKLTEQLRESRKENDFLETDLHGWNDELTQMAQELAKPSIINLRQDAAPFINKILVDITSESSYILQISTKTKWIQHGITVAGDNGQGNELNQFYQAGGIYVDDDQTVYIADFYNDRIVEWKSGAISARVVAGGKGRGNRTDQLNGPTDVIIDKKSDCFVISDYDNKRVVRWSRRNGTSGQTIISKVGCWSLAMDEDGYLYVPDHDKSEVKRWRVGDATGTIVAGGNGKGDRLNQISGRFYIFVDGNHSIYVSEEENHRVTKWIKGAKEGIVVAGGCSEGASLTQLGNPTGIVVDRLGTVYVAEVSNHRITRWPVGARQCSIVVGGRGKGRQANQLSSPTRLTFDRQGNLYVVDNGNCRVQRFNIDSNSNV